MTSPNGAARGLIRLVLVFGGLSVAVAAFAHYL